MKIIQVKDNTYCIDVDSAYIPLYKLNEKDIVLLDTGSPSQRDLIQSALDENKFNVVGIINSHSHPDHVGNNKYFKEKYNCLIAMPMYEAGMCSSLLNLKASHSNMTLTELEEQYGFMIFETDEYITSKQEEINFCGVNFKIMHTPGHSPSHICIITPDDVGYMGDALISYELIDSIKIPFGFVLSEDLKCKDNLISLECSRYIVAHKGIYDDITNLIADNIRFYISRAESILDVIQGKMTMGEITKAALKNFRVAVNNMYKYELLFRMVGVYVDYLYETGRVRLVLDKDLRKYEKNEDNKLAV